MHSVKKITKRKERDVALLKARLDLYSDEWRTAQPEPQFKGEMPSLIPATNNVVVRKKYKKREKQTSGDLIKTEDAIMVKEEPFAIEATAGVHQSTTSNTSPSPQVLKKTKSGKLKKKKSKVEKVMFSI